MLMNFGPINQRGGEKRLNVIFSRARHHMAVVSTIRHEAITNDHNEGAAALKQFLRYAECLSRGDTGTARRVLEGMNPLTRAGSVQHARADEVTVQLAAALRARGHAVDEQVGQSRFRCDLALRAPEAGHYALGILIDTAGRYSVHDEDRQEWLAFLAMLKKNRPKAPINGILIAASVAELVQARPDAVIRLAKSLRQRVQELTETLEVYAPVYVMFTKADLISGFVEFFEDRDPDERQRAWGATLPYTPDERVDAVAQFSRHFDELHEGLKQLALAHMSLHRGKPLPPAVLAFPLEFAAAKPALQAFVATLFEDNPDPNRPVFGGF